MTTPRLTTRKADRFSDLELELLAVTDRVHTGVTWLIRGHSTPEEFDAAFNLQRWGYFVPTTDGKQYMPDSAEGLRKLGFKITDEGRQALRVAVERERRAA